MRLLFTILLLSTFSASWGQGSKFTYGGNNAKVYVLGDILFPKYATSDPNKVLAVDAGGNIILVNTTIGGVDSTIFQTVYGNDTGKLRITRMFAGYAPLSGATYTGDVNINSNYLYGLRAPTNDDEAVNFGTLKDFNSGFLWKPSATVATATTLPAFIFDGSQSLVFTATGACPTVDGRALHDGDTILNKNSTGANEPFNGIFYVSQAGGTGINCVLTRAPYANTENGLTRATLSITSGTINAGTVYTQINTITTVNVSPVTFQLVPLAAASAGYGLTKDGNTLSIDPTKVVTKDSVFNNPPWINTLAWSKITGAPAFSTSFAALTDVSLSSLINGQLTKYNAVSSKWENFTPTYISGNQNISITGAVTGSGTTNINTTLSNGVVGIANLSATGTPSATTYLRGDNTWQPVSGGGSASVVVAGTGINVATSGTTYTVTNTAPDQTVGLLNIWGLNITGTYPSFSLGVDSFAATSRGRSQKLADSVINYVVSQGYATSGSLLGVTTYSVAGTYTVSVPAGTTRILYRAYGGGGGAGACLGNTSLLSVSGGGAAGAKAEGYFSSWSSIVATVGAAGSAGAITGCPTTCVASSGGAGGTTTIVNGATTITCPGGGGSALNTAANTNKAIKGGSAIGLVATGANITNGGAISGGDGIQIANLVPNSSSGTGAAYWEVGQGGEGFTASNTAGNNAVGNASGGGGCISATSTGSANSKNGGAGAPGIVIFMFYK